MADFVSLVLIVLMFLAFLIAARYFELWWEKPTFKTLSNLPGPYSLLFLGNLIQILGYSLHASISGSPAAVLRRLHKKYGPVYKLQFGKHPIVILGGVDNLQVALFSSKVLSKESVDQTVSEISSKDSNEVSADDWKHDRKRLQPIFCRAVIKEHIPKMNEIINNAVSEMKKQHTESEFDINEKICPIILDVFLQTQFNYTLTSEEKKTFDLHKDVHRVYRSMIIQKMLPFMKMKWIREGMRKICVDPIRNKYIRLIRKMVNEEKERGGRSEKDASNKTKMVTNLFETTSENENDGNEWLENHIFLFLSSGTDSISSVVSGCLLLIAMHPNVQDKLNAELNKILGNSQRAVTYEDIDKLIYLDQVVKETQRIWTLTPFVLRNVEEDFQIGLYNLSAGTPLLLDFTSIHYDPLYYPRPFEFNPENFSAEAVSKRPKLSFLPFSAGFKQCIGRELAALEIRLMLIAMLRNFSFSTTKKMENIKLKYTIVTYNPGGYLVSVRPKIKDV